MTSLPEIKKHMEKAIDHLRGEISKLRVGRASVSMLDGVKVESYGSQVGLKEVAALGTPDAKTITIQPWDRGVINDVEKAILAANLGLTPINDGKLIRVNLPPLTEERRKDFVKGLKKNGEETKVSVRNVRRDALDAAKKSDMTEDDKRRFQDDLQKLTDQSVAEVDKIVEAKSQELLTL
ncbi:ribosome recycling factor [bacterium]|nr:ribosome recycling factor [bacterium]